jgi:hypothetical protein
MAREAAEFDWKSFPNDLPADKAVAILTKHQSSTQYTLSTNQENIHLSSFNKEVIRQYNFNPE